MQKNPSIGCTVSNCQFHAGNENYCTLQQIMVGTHGHAAKQVECTDCESFKLKS